MSEFDTFLKALNLQINVVNLFLCVIILYAVGQGLKRWPWFKNLYIPLVLAVLGAVLWPLFLDSHTTDPVTKLPSPLLLKDRVVNSAFGFTIGWMSSGLYEFLRRTPFLKRFLSVEQNSTTPETKPKSDNEQKP